MAHNEAHNMAHNEAHNMAHNTTINITDNLSAAICPIRTVYVHIHYIYLLGIGPLCVIGLNFNCLIFLTIRHRQVRVSGNQTNSFLLQQLAISDGCFLVISFVFFVVRHLYERLRNAGELTVYKLNDTAIGYILFFATIFPYFFAQQIRSWVVVTMSVDRFLHIRFPFWARKYATVQLYKTVFTANIAISAFVHLFTGYLTHGVVLKPHRCLPGRPRYLGKFYGFVSWDIMRKYNSITYFVFLIGVPLLVLCCVNILLISAVRRAAKLSKSLAAEGDSSSGEARAQNQATLMVIAAVAVFILCESPACVDRVAGLIYAFKAKDFVETSYSV
ncbi:uncharacterized protein LOC141907843 [Tubulanus polymorphus]|uniref:uncharacterized protein LOC141907843 n=1 Tax=Tubulanus polymorphus TaxID=672921 RepID=UPI003DA30F4D